jgi:G3E family GTPase
MSAQATGPAVAGSHADEAWQMLAGFLQASRVIPETQRAAAGSLPLTVISGFLGAGKTTLVNRLLSEPHGLKLAVLVNDFGRINIDASLIRSRTEAAIELTNGCACCSVAGDLARSIVELAQREQLPDAIVIEASGLADPRGIVQVALANPALRLDGIVALVDAETLIERAADSDCAPTLLAQIEASDVVVLNKRDLVSDEHARACREWLEARGCGRPVIEAAQADVPHSIVLGIASERTFAPGQVDARHADGFDSMSLALDAPLDRQRVRELLGALPPDVLRAKGILWLADDAEQQTVYQRVGRRWGWAPEGPWRSEPRLSRLVLIGRRGTLDRDDFTRRLRACISLSATPRVTL